MTLTATSTINPQDLAKQFGLKVVTDLKDYPFVKERLRKLPYAFAKSRSVLPFDKNEGKTLVAFANPFDLELLEEVRHLIGAVEEVYASEAEIEAAIEECYHQEEGETSAYLEDLKGGAEEKKVESEGYDLLDTKSASPVIRMLNMILTEAVQQGASDVHFEPQEKGMAIRYRIDGALVSRHAPPRELQGQLVTRIKVMAKLDIAEHRLPQDGRIKLMMTGREIDFRVSTVPVVYGERVVLRILDRGNILLGLEKIHMPERCLKTFRKLIRQSQGIVLVTGPTGSGKTTTLYSAISDINSVDVNIMTIEDPVEYKLSGMAQIGVNPKIDLTFSKGLRHILRQDPDIIMIGEIRDKETAEIAIQSSLTGHLVLSTLHTNDAPSALTRLIDMGIEPYLISSSVLAVLAQRLVRKICTHCKTSYVPEEAELVDLGLEGEHTFYQGEGCEKCFHSGYRGRLGLYEIMPLNGAIKQQMLKSADATLLQKVAYEQGMRSLREEGAARVLNGETTTAEVLRVTRGTD